MEQIRIGAARQHVDAVLVYEVLTSSERHSTVLSVLDFTLIAMLALPTRSVDSTGIASALLFDVRNGYPYITVSATAKDSRFSSADDLRDAARSQEQQVKSQAVAALIQEVTPLFDKLQMELAAKGKVVAKAKE